jgi:hypothetical protein
MSLFDSADRQASAAIDRFFADPIVWRPMAHRAGSRFTSSGSNPSAFPDPTRPVRGLDQTADPFVAVVAWKPAVTDPGTYQNEQGGLPANDVMIEFDIMQFTRDGIVDLPRKGDVFDIPTQDGQHVSVVLPRETVDDGTQRVQCWCVAPE